MNDIEEKKPFLQRMWVVVTGAAISCLLWGSAFPSIKTGYRLFQIATNDTASQILFAGVRFTLAGILTVIIGSIGSRKLLLPAQKSWGRILVLCLFQTILQYFFFYGGLAHTSGVKSSVIVGTNVFVAIIVAAVLFRQEKLTFRKIGGCLLGFSGVVLVNISGTSIDASFHLNGEGFILLSTFAYALSSVFMKRFSKDDNPVMLSGWQFIIGGAIMAAAGFLCGGRMSGFALSSIILLIYLALISAVAYSIWSMLLKYNHVSRVVVFGFLNPVFGVILSAIVLGEGNQTGPVTVLALALVCCGIVIVSKKNE